MPPWQNTELKQQTCRNCSSMFMRKRSAKYCSQTCENKARYKRHGQRATPEVRSAWYRDRVEVPGVRDKLNEQARVRRERVMRFIRDFKLRSGCIDCGYKAHHAALEFDHVRGEKALNVCFAKSIAQAKAEMKKCEVVCANCHRIRTYERLQNPCKPDIFKATYDPA